MTVTLIGRSDPDLLSRQQPLEIPLFLERVSAGFPSPAQDYIEQTLDLNNLCIEHPAATFFVRVQGDSMIEAGICPNDILVVDRSLQAIHGDIVIASLYGELTVKALELRPVARLVPRNQAYPAIEVTDGDEIDIFGVVTSVVRNLRQRP